MELEKLATHTNIYLVTHELTADLSVEQLLSWFNHHPSAESFLWEAPNQNQQIFAWGKFDLTLDGNPLAKFDQAVQLLKQLTPRIVRLAQAELSDLRLVGGQAFALETGLPTHWGRLTNGAVWLPRITFNKVEGKIRLSIIGETATAVTQQLHQILMELANEGQLVAQSAVIMNFREESVSRWKSQVAKAIQSVHETKLNKVVLGRFATGTVIKAAPEALWLQLRKKQVGAYHIMLRSQGVTFLCASPERLVAFRPHQVLTAALAGTTKRGATRQVDKRRQADLMRDPKNLQEHAFVVDWITQVLTASGMRVDHAVHPQILQTPAVSHLYTPITAAGVVSPSQLLDKITPTPALGGVPQQLAIKLITQLESQQRGLFGAPIGFLDATGQGEFAVGIRSCFLRDQQAYFFAGAGIVADSVPANEAAETGAKFKAILSIFERKQTNPNE
ncbi:isochorismate synthase [Limosilactobacillus fermentum]|uniref:isochorismate synthase n=1 Tax=Limosilactobacillus fermentum TaxID=1613 RepID=UPI003B6712DF